MKASGRVHRAPPLVGWSRTRCPIQNSWNGSRSVGPHLIGLRSHLFKHVKIVLVSGATHFLEDTDISTGNVRHAQAEQRSKSIRTHQPGAPRMSRTPVMGHEDGAGGLQRIEQTNQVTSRLQRRVQGCVERDCGRVAAASELELT